LIRIYFIEFLLAGALLLILGYAAFHLYLYVADKLNTERQIDKQIRRDAEEALADLIREKN